MIKGTLEGLAAIYAAFKEDNQYHGHVSHANLIFVIPATKRSIIRKRCIQAITTLLCIPQMKKEWQTPEHINTGTAAIFVKLALSTVIGIVLNANMTYAMIAIRRQRSKYNNQFNNRLVKLLNRKFGVLNCYSLRYSKHNQYSKVSQSTIISNNKTYLA